MPSPWFNIICVAELRQLGISTLPILMCQDKRLCQHSHGVYTIYLPTIVMLGRSHLICSYLLCFKSRVYWSTIGGPRRRVLICKEKHFNLQLFGIELCTNFVYQTNNSHKVTDWLTGWLADEVAGWLMTWRNNTEPALSHWLIICLAVQISLWFVSIVLFIYYPAIKLPMLLKVFLRTL